MKGISHFITGVASASFFPWSVDAALNGNPLYFVLGGVFGILPDTMDFKFYRFFYKHDVYIAPDPTNPDPQVIADEFASAINRAHETGKEIRVKLNTIRMGVDYWQQYIIKIDVAAREVLVRFGSVVNTGQVPIPGSVSDQKQIGRAKITVPFDHTYEAVTTVDIFDGPTFAMTPNKEGRVELQFLPWHRTWSHNLVTGCAFGLLGWLLWGWRAAIVIPIAFAAHVMEDQLGYMGSNLFWPFTPKRFQGMKRMHAVDALPNFLVVWTCCLLIFWNLYRAIETPLLRFNILELFLWGLALPLAIGVVLNRWFNRAGKGEQEEIDSSGEWIEDVMT